MTRLPVWRTTVESYGLVLRNLGAFLRLGLPAFVILVVCQPLVVWLSADPWLAAMQEFAQIAEGAQEGGVVPPSEEEMQQLSERFLTPILTMMAVQLVGVVVMVFAGAMVTVAWCRYAALGDDRGGRWFALRFGETEIEMVAAFLMLGIGGFLAMTAIFVVSVMAVAAIGFAGQAVMAVLVTAVFLAMCRFSMLLPQVAVGGGLDPTAAWRRTKGQTLRLFAVYGLIGLPFLLVALVAQGIWAVVMIGRMEALQQNATPERMMELMMPWHSTGEIMLGAFVLLVPYVVFNGLAYAVFCAAMGLGHARLAAAPVDVFD